MTKMKATLPPWELNGLGQLREQLLKDPGAQHVAIIVLDCSRITEDIEEGEKHPTPTIRIQRIEPETDPDMAAELLAWLNRLTHKRIPPPARPEPIPGLDLQGGTGLQLGGRLRSVSRGDQ